MAKQQIGTLASSIAPLRDAFNASVGRPRLIALMSPT